MRHTQNGASFLICLCYKFVQSMCKQAEVQFAKMCGIGQFYVLLLIVHYWLIL